MSKREKRDKAFAKGFDEGYEQFKIGSYSVRLKY